MQPEDSEELPAGLPVPMDDGACDHLLGMLVPAIPVSSTSGRYLRLDKWDAPRTVLFCFSHMCAPNEEPPGGLTAWNALPGARGCTPQAIGFRDRTPQILAAAARVFGMAAQPLPALQELGRRHSLPFDLLSDADLNFARVMRLPTFQVANKALLRRCTLILHRSRIEKVFYPVFPPHKDAARVLAYLEKPRQQQDTIFG